MAPAKARGTTLWLAILAAASPPKPSQSLAGAFEEAANEVLPDFVLPI